MAPNSNIKLTLNFNNPDLEPEEQDEQAQQLLDELQAMDEVERVERVHVEQAGTLKTDVAVSAIATYLGCAESVPLSQRMAEFEKRLAALEVEARGNS